ncbi:cyclic diguanylate phosphodiesterase (EAL) domain-containing protein [Klebsiella variicola]|uniref:Cyclic diguanylate phosphodiesterase (EAL) domain-containing protein n=1 Tax=Klebsiella variicola TaxID=244366 RepID=A0A7H4MRX5_KLEVA|nr:cyclic diguanylate phosphodiesterase (EAL) domain-containing protein [Klebsiella variicola]
MPHSTCVHFEVTENAENLLNNSLAAWQNPQDTSLWLDDFGSGYAGINAIRGYHFDYVKIDKDFFWHLMRKDSGRQLNGCPGDLFIPQSSQRDY